MTSALGNASKKETTKETTLHEMLHKLEKMAKEFY